MSNYFKTLSDCKKEKGEGDSCQYVTKCQYESSKRDEEDAYFTCLAQDSLPGGGSKKRSRRRSKLKKRSRRRSKFKKRSRRRSKFKKRHS